jgi:two-component sensor histidine kinase
VALTDALRGARDPVEAQGVAMRVLGDHLGASRVMYGEADAGSDEFFTNHREYRPSSGMPTSLGGHRWDSFGRYVVAEMRAGRTLVVNDVRAHPGHSADDIAAYEAVGIRAYVAVPLVWEGRIEAYLAVNHTTAHAWTAEEISLTEETAERTWAAVAHARAEEDLKASERRARLLLAELQHRVRNTLSVVRSIARRTARTSESVEDYAMHLDGRIDAFARVQATVTRNPSAGVALDILVADSLLAVGAHEGEQVRHINGPKFRLQPKPAEMVALALHELATNAVKYGALTIKGGRIAVEWRLESVGEHPRLMFDWIETGMKLSGEKPERRGFGMELIERTLAYDLGGIARLRFTPKGVHCTINLPADGEVLLEEGQPVRNS